MDTLMFGEEDEKPSVPESVLQNLLLQPKDEELDEQSGRPIVKAVVPNAGFCLKTKSDQGGKVFINVCKSAQIPSPKDITDEQLVTLLESGDPSSFRVPLSLGEPHVERDNAGNDCTTYDVIIGTKFFEVIQKRSVMKDFLLTVALEGLEDKYNIKLSRECKILKNRKFVGSLPEQTVREKPKPFIIEMNKDEDERKKEAEMEKLLKEKAPEPKYSITREPVEGDVPEFLVMEISLPGISSSRQLFLEVGEDMVVLRTRPKLFQLDVDLPFLVNCDEAGAQFHRQTKILTLTLSVTGKAVL